MKQQSLSRSKSSLSLGRRSYNILRGYVNREWDRLSSVNLSRDEADAERELSEFMPPIKEIVAPADVVPREVHARRLLGVAHDASFSQIHKTFERLNKRSDPKNFPEGSDEAIHAAQIQKRVNWAYGVLSEGVDTTEKRFRSLEIE